MSIFVRLFCMFAIGIELAKPVATLSAESDPDSTQKQKKNVSMSVTEMGAVLRRFKQELDLFGGLPPPIEIKGTHVFRGDILVTQQIIFHPGSKLIFQGAQSEKNGLVMYILTPKIVFLDPEDSAILTWNLANEIPPMPPEVGKAQSGKLGDRVGANGGDGADGSSGNSGYAGLSGPTLYLAVNEIVGRGLFFDLRGQAGGPGGVGQAGGDGGPGRSGSNAFESQNPPNRGFLANACGRPLVYSSGGEVTTIKRRSVMPVL